MVNGLRIGSSEIGGLMFDAPIVGGVYSMDFVNDWVVNPDNSAGVTVVDGKIIVTKVKPKTWFIKSNYGFSSAAERDDFFMSKSFRLSGLEALWNDNVGGITTVVDNPIGDTRVSYYPTGLIISPVNSNGALLSHVYPWDMGIPNGSFKHVYGRSQGWADYGYGHDEDIIMYNNACGYDNYSEVALAFWTGVDGDQGDDGYLTLTTPITISLENQFVVNPTTRESWKACVGTDVVYLKPKTFQSALIRYDLAVIETGNYTEKIQGSTIPIVRSEWQREHGPSGDAIAYVATDRNVAKLYDNFEFPNVDDIEELVNQGWPMKFWVKQHDRPSGDGFWASVIAGFSRATISDPMYTSCLFAASDIRLASSEATVILNLSNKPETLFSLDKTFDHSNVENVVINISSGSVRSIRDSFRADGSLKSLSFNATGTGSVDVHTLNGAFEYCSLPLWPQGLRLSNSQRTTLSEMTIGTAYAFHGCGLGTIGTENQDDSSWNTMLLDYEPIHAFNSGSLGAIYYIIDFKFVSPSYNAERCLNAPNLNVARIKNLNKGDWSLDGVERNGVCNGNLSGLDADSVNYLLDNLFDLRLNTSDASHLESKLNSFNDWTATSGERLSTQWDVSSDGVISAVAVPAGTMSLRIEAMRSGDRITVGNTTITSDGNYDIQVSGNVSISATIGDGVVHTVYISLSDHFKSELTYGLSAATLYLPSALSSKASQSSLSAASEKGWTIIFGS